MAAVPDVMKGFFGKMARQTLHHIRVGSLGEPGERIEPCLGEADARDPSSQVEVENRALRGFWWVARARTERKRGRRTTGLPA